MSVDTIEKLFVAELKDLYSAESQITKALPKMAKAAKSTELRSAFEHHLKETEGGGQEADGHLGEGLLGRESSGLRFHCTAKNRWGRRAVCAGGTARYFQFHETRGSTKSQARPPAATRAAANRNAKFQPKRAAR